MTKPTGRPKGRPKVKEYVTLMARVPLELVEQARKYAARKQQPISEVLRDGLLLLLEQEDTAPHYVYDRFAPPVKMSDTKAAILPSFDTSKFYLGTLCPKGHDYHGTGQSLLRKHNQRCRECENTSKRDKRAREKAQRK